MHPEMDLSPAILGRSLMVELQSLGMRMEEGRNEAPSRRGGAGPSDHKAVLIDGVAAMIPIYTETAGRSPFTSTRPDANGLSILSHNGNRLGSLSFPKQPRFYALQTMDGIPYWKIA